MKWVEGEVDFNYLGISIFVIYLLVFIGYI